MSSFALRHAAMNVLPRCLHICPRLNLLLRRSPFGPKQKNNTMPLNIFTSCGYGCRRTFQRIGPCPDHLYIITSGQGLRRLSYNLFRRHLDLFVVLACLREKGSRSLTRSLSPDFQFDESIWLTAFSHLLHLLDDRKSGWITYDVDTEWLYSDNMKRQWLDGCVRVTIGIDSSPAHWSSFCCRWYIKLLQLCARNSLQRPAYNPSLDNSA